MGKKHESNPIPVERLARVENSIDWIKDSLENIDQRFANLEKRQDQVLIGVVVFGIICIVAAIIGAIF